ncbi:MAG: putative toxin-antitoxin system toxin component, PIN family [Chloroflexota bacterium]
MHNICVRIAIDTNLLIAALTKPGGTSGRLVQAWRDGLVDNVASEATVREAEAVLGGRWLERLAGRDRVRQLLRDLREHSAWVEDPPLIDDLDLKDAGDLRMVEAAVAGGAELIATTDREFLSKRGYGSVEFVTAGEALRRIGAAG